MKSRPQLRQVILSLIILILPSFATMSCSGSGNTTLADFTPASQFIVDFDNPGTDVSVARTAPYFGSNSTCPHNGAHIHFANNSENALGYVNILAPMAGTVSEIQTCKTLGESDGFQINLQSDDFTDVTFEMSIEPQNGFYCVTDEGGDADFYKDLILVNAGDAVVAGQILALMPISNTASDSGHIHFNLRQNENACPNIFDADITERFAEEFTDLPCDIPQTSTFCYAPDVDEDITGLFTETF